MNYYNTKIISTESISYRQMTVENILDFLDMADCHNMEIRVFDSETDEELIIYGKWHNVDNPLYMMAVYPHGRIAFDGFGTDH